MNDKPSSRMIAVIRRGPGQCRVEQVDRPAPGPRRMTVPACASDCKRRSGAKMAWGDANGACVKPPVIPSHRFFGVADDPGEGAAPRLGVQPGNTLGPAA